MGRQQFGRRAVAARAWAIGAAVLALVLEVASMAAAADATALAPPAAEAERMTSCHALITALVREFPTDLQVEAIHLAEDIHQHLWGWRKDSRTAAERQQTLHAIERFEADLAGILPRVEVDWGATAVALPTTPAPIAVARGLARPLLLAIRNRTDGPLAIAVSNTAGASSAMPTQAIPAAAQRCLLVALCLPEPAADVAIELVDAAGGRRSARLPVAFAEPAGLRGALEEGPQGRIWPGRVQVRGSDGIYRHAKAFADNSTLSEKPVVFRPLWHRLPFFYSDGHFEITVPPGPTTLTLERGCEHEVVTRSLDAPSGAATAVVLRSARFLDMQALGWVSGDTHVHWAKNSWDANEDLALLAIVQRAEDLRVVNNLTLYQYRPPAAGGPFTKPDQYPMGPVPGYCVSEYHIQMAEEYRNDTIYGHINLLGLTQLIEPLATGAGSGGAVGAPDWPHNRAAIEACRQQGGISAEAHGFGPCENGDAAANAVLGLTDLMDQLDTRYYYLLLNAGVRVPLGNGSDHPARVAGCARMYAKVDGAFSYAGWLAGIRAGRTFVTSGPLLFLTVNGQEIGSQLDVAPGTALVVEARAVSRRPLGRLQILANGQVVQEVVTAEREARLRFDLAADQPRWFVARCAPTAEFTAIRTAEEEYTARPDIAHTSATYVDVAGQAAFDPGAARELVGRFQAHAEDIAKRGVFADDAQRRQAVAHVEAATRVLEQRLAPTGAAVAPANPPPALAARGTLAPIPHRRARAKLATVQVPIDGEALQGRDPADVLAPHIERAGREGVDLVVFPEFTLGLFDLNGAVHTKVSTAARRANVNVVVGGWEMLAGFDPKAVPFAPRTYANCALVIARDGSLVGHYHKAHAAVGDAPYCWPPRAAEAGEWTMKWGEELPVFDLDIGRIGVLTCYDGFFFPMFETLSLKGAEILVWINGRPGIEDYIIKTASFMTCTAVITGNNAKGMGATICDYPAHILARQEQPGEAYLSADIDLDRLRRERRNNRMFHQRRPDLYRELLQDWPVWEYYPDLPGFEYPKP